TGIVKGWATERAARVLAEAGAAGVNVNGGGDVQLLGAPGPERPWRVGVSDPVRPGGLAAVVSAAGVDELAVATSGTAERGDHIIDSRTRRSAVTNLVAVTVVAPSLTWADCWATAAFAMGSRAGLAWLESLPGVEALLITGGEVVRCTAWVAGGRGGGGGGQAGVRRRRAAAGRWWVCAVPRAPGERALAVVVTCRSGEVPGGVCSPAPLKGRGELRDRPQLTRRSPPCAPPTPSSGARGT